MKSTPPDPTIQPPEDYLTDKELNRRYFMLPHEKWKALLFGLAIVALVSGTSTFVLARTVARAVVEGTAAVAAEKRIQQYEEDAKKELESMRALKAQAAQELAVLERFRKSLESADIDLRLAKAEGTLAGLVDNHREATTANVETKFRVDVLRGVVKEWGDKFTEANDQSQANARSIASLGSRLDNVEPFLQRTGRLVATLTREEEKTIRNLDELARHLDYTVRKVNDTLSKDDKRLWEAAVTDVPTLRRHIMMRIAEAAAGHADSGGQSK